MNKTENKQCILLVDDDQKILFFLGLKLRASGYDVITAITGQDALTLVESQKPDMMVLDIIMPGMSGLDVLKELRISSDLAVIAISARTDSADEALSLGAKSFMSKPFNPDELVKRIQAILDHKR